MLKDETLPSVEVTLAEHLSSSKNNLDASYRLSSLIERYATRSVESRILAVLDPMSGKALANRKATSWHMLSASIPKRRARVWKRRSSHAARDSPDVTGDYSRMWGCGGARLCSRNWR